MFKIQKLENQTLSSKYWSAQNANMRAFSKTSISHQRTLTDQFLAHLATYG